MPLDQAVKYGGEGFAIGSSLGGPIGGAIGGGIGAIGGLLFGKSDEEIRNEHFQQFLNVLAADRKKKIEETGKQFSGMVQQASSNARRRAGAAGRQDNAEDYILPAQGQATRAYGDALRAALEPFDTAKLNAEAEFAGRPIEPGAMDYLAAGAGQYANYMQENKLIEALSKNPSGAVTQPKGEITNLMENFGDSHDALVGRNFVGQERTRRGSMPTRMDYLDTVFTGQ